MLLWVYFAHGGIIKQGSGFLEPQACLLDIAELSATTKELINFSGSVVATINEFSAATEEHINNITENIFSFSAATVAEVNRIDETVNAFSAATVAEVNRIDEIVEQEKNERYANDLTPGTYVLDGNYSSEMVIPTNSKDLSDVKIKVSDDFFNFGEF